MHAMIHGGLGNFSLMALTRLHPVSRIGALIRGHLRANLELFIERRVVDLMAEYIEALSDSVLSATTH